MTWCNIFIWYLLKLEWYTTECRYPQWYSGFSAIFTHLFVLICLVRSLQRNNLLHYDWVLLVYFKKINFKNLTFFFCIKKHWNPPPPFRFTCIRYTYGHTFLESIGLIFTWVTFNILLICSLPTYWRKKVQF